MTLLMKSLPQLYHHNQQPISDKQHIGQSTAEATAVTNYAHVSLVPWRTWWKASNTIFLHNM